MRIRRVELTEFKRFTHLVVDEIPQSARLVVLAGPNGCGKSSFFEGLYSWYRSLWSGIGHSWDDQYHAKQLHDEGEPSGDGSRRVRVSREFNERIKIAFYDPQPASDMAKRAAVYVRSAYRNEPAFQLSQLRRMGTIVAENRFNRFTENDATVQNNYQRLVSQGLSAIYRTEDPTMTIGEFREKTIGDIQAAMRRLFPSLILNDLGDPLDQGTFYFDKGASREFAYQNLSGGEKAAFDLVLDIVVKRTAFGDSIYCIDEPEAHMNTRLQAALLEEVHALVPESCQLWIATHSIGMMRRARDMHRAKPESVVFLDFGDKDYDREVIIRPEVPARAFWHRVLNVALDDVAELVVPETIVICEGKPRVSEEDGNAAIDAACYNTVFEDEYPHAQFISAGNVHDVKSDRMALVQAMKGLVAGVTVLRLIDRDDQSDQEINNAKRLGVRVLTHRHLESYMFDDQVLTALCHSRGKGDLVGAVIEAKAKAIDEARRRCRAPDDMKSASGTLYVALKKTLDLMACGNNVKAFMRDTLAPLLRPGMEPYETLRRDVFGERASSSGR